MKIFKSLKWFEVAILAIILSAGLAFAQFAYESITVSYTVKTLTAATYGAGVRSALITVETNAIRFTLDGVQTPTSAGVGHLLYPGETRILDKYEIVKFKAVRASATDAVLKVTYY